MAVQLLWRILTGLSCAFDWGSQLQSNSDCAISEKESPLWGDWYSVQSIPSITTPIPSPDPHSSYNTTKHFTFVVSLTKNPPNDGGAKLLWLFIETCIPRFSILGESASAGEVAVQPALNIIAPPLFPLSTLSSFSRYNTVNDCSIQTFVSHHMTELAKFPTLVEYNESLTRFRISALVIWAV